MRYTALCLLMSLPLMCGCKASMKHVEAVEYRPGTEPRVIPSKYDAEYSLYEPDVGRGQPGFEAAKGEPVGFRREPDGSLVAVVGKETKPIPEGRYVWKYKPKPVTRWDRFTFAAHDRAETATACVMGVFLLPLLIVYQAVTGEPVLH
jgi:hypothetical protein